MADTSTLASVTGVPSYSDYLKEQAMRNTKNELGREDFLQLLTATLQYQDPLEPQKDTDFIAQLASFNTLMQMESLNQTMTQYTSYGMVGKYAVAVYRDDNNMEVAVAGTIDRVFTQNKVVYAQIGEHIFEASKITDVFDMGGVGGAEAATSAMMENLIAYNLIGKTVTVQVDDPNHGANVMVDNPAYVPPTIPNPEYDEDDAADATNENPYTVPPIIDNPAYNAAIHANIPEKIMNPAYVPPTIPNPAYNSVTNNTVPETIPNPAYVSPTIPNPEYNWELAALKQAAGAEYKVPLTIPNPNYRPKIAGDTGVVESVTRDANGVVVLTVKLADGTYKTFPAGDVINVKGTEDNSAKELQDRLDAILAALDTVIENTSPPDEDDDDENP
ncbi:MAG: hypothetical protein LBN43_09400 [Oscillospiraceae bacterium]|jgi:flagellar hook assembly protein FlgD|nr:hypothetical protein [Oscillospiraceae bacterium]